MFREMRRKKQALSAEENAAVLTHGASGVLALSGDNGFPYAVPISYVYDGTNIYFHCAKSGHKLDAIRRNSKASFCVVDKDEIIPEKYTSCFRSVIVFGTIHIMENEQEKRETIEKLALKYAPEDSADHRRAFIEKDWDLLCVLEMKVEHMSGKEGIELVKAKQSKT